jgi:hypothetical protein
MVIWQRLVLRKDFKVAIRALARRTAVVLALILPAAGLILAAGLPQASACSGADQCSTLAINNHIAANHGVLGDLYVTCLYQPDNGNRVATEVADKESSGSTVYWVEAGVASGVDYHSHYLGDEWFAESFLPGQNFMEDDTGSEASLNTVYPVEITYAGGGTWDFIGGNSTNIFDTVTDSFSATQAEGGTQYTSDPGGGIRDIGNIFDLQNQGLNGTWYDLGSAATNHYIGPGPFISGSYNNSTSEESWSGPC